MPATNPQDLERAQVYTVIIEDLQDRISGLECEIHTNIVDGWQAINHSLRQRLDRLRVKQMRLYTRYKQLQVSDLDKYDYDLLDSPRHPLTNRLATNDTDEDDEPDDLPDL
jgi:hypothetical protein